MCTFWRYPHEIMQSQFIRHQFFYGRLHFPTVYAWKSKSRHNYAKTYLHFSSVCAWQSNTSGAFRYDFMSPLLAWHFTFTWYTHGKVNIVVSVVAGTYTSKLTFRRYTREKVIPTSEPRQVLRRGCLPVCWLSDGICAEKWNSILLLWEFGLLISSLSDGACVEQWNSMLFYLWEIGLPSFPLSDAICVEKWNSILFVLGVWPTQIFTFWRHMGGK